MARTNKPGADKLDLTEKRTKELMWKHGVWQKGWRFKFDGATRRFGCCRYYTKMITLSRALCKANGMDRIELTILHEIAHALCPGHHHDHVWKAKCKEIGGDGKRCYSYANTTAPVKAMGLQEEYSFIAREGRWLYGPPRITHVPTSALDAYVGDDIVYKGTLIGGGTYCSLRGGVGWSHPRKAREGVFLFIGAKPSNKKNQIYLLDQWGGKWTVNAGHIDLDSIRHMNRRTIAPLHGIGSNPYTAKES
jgi:hypothetical protein